MSRRRRTARVRYSPKIMKLIQEQKGLPQFAWPGGYPLFYFITDGSNRNEDVACWKCASGRGALGSDDKVVNYEVNWEDDSLFCGACNERIESAYAE